MTSVQANGNGAPRALSVTEAFRGKVILVTGVTGFVAKVWVAMLLCRVPQLGRLILLVRPHKHHSAQKRFEQMVWSSPAFRPLREQHGDAFRAFLADKVEVIEGDIRQPRCGLSVEAHAQLAQRIDATVHLAGVTEFQADPQHAIAANVEGGIHVADLAALSPSRRMILVSSAFVAGCRDGEVAEALAVDQAPSGIQFDPAEELRTIKRACSQSDSKFGDPASTLAKKARIAAGLERATTFGWPNIYLYTKGLAEHMLARRQDIELTIVRPSVVECARSFPFAGWNEGIDTAGPLVWLLSTPYRWIPLRPGNRFDVVPVDSVARGLCVVTAMALEGRAAAVNHLTSSEINPLTFHRAIELAGLGLRLHRYNEKRHDVWQRLWTHLDGIPVDPQLHFKQLTRWRDRLKLAEAMVNRIKMSDQLPHPIAKWLSANVRKAGTHLRNGGRTLGRIEHLLRLYKPFTCDYNYTFRADNVSEGSARLNATESALFGYDIASLDWRDYWLHVEIPGLMTWCTPLLEGKDVPQDPVPEHTSLNAPKKVLGSESVPVVGEARL